MDKNNGTINIVLDDTGIIEKPFCLPPSSAPIPIPKRTINRSNRPMFPTPIVNPKKPVHDYFIIDDIVYFALRGRALQDSTYAMVSKNKWPDVSKYEWYLSKSGYPITYDLSRTKLHRFVYTITFNQIIPSKMFVDHINRNKLDNTDDNLRLVTPQENSFNKSTKTNTKGVKKISDSNYSATVCKDGKRHTITGIATETEAAEVYNLMAEELFGVFAAKNIIR